MNIEMSRNTLISRWPGALRYGSQIVGIFRAIVRRPAKTVARNETGITRQTRIEREQCQAMATAQLQAFRYMR
jgi:hypothetical protein